MSLTSFRRKSRPKRPASTTPVRPRPWPVDPELTRRAAETGARIERTRGQLALHVLPKHNPAGETYERRGETWH
jgi:hypothetical protein